MYGNYFTSHTIFCNVQNLELEGDSMSPFFKRRTKKKNEKNIPTIPDSEIIKSNQDKQISENLKENINKINEIFQNDLDFSVRKFKIFGTMNATLICFKSMVSKDVIDRDIIKPLQEMELPKDLDVVGTDYILEQVLYYSDTKIIENYSKMLQSLTVGKTIVFVEGINKAIEFDAVQIDKRSIEQPETERVVVGPRDGFIEQIFTNIGLMRYRLPVPEFRIEQTEVGTRSHTKIAICYLEDIANPTLVEEVKKRIDAVEIDSILDAGYLEQFIQDNPWSPFPQILNTERPDKAIANILEGRVTILVDGSPFALIVPATFHQFYQTNEDYNVRWLISSFIRIIRLIALVFSLTFSSFYVTALSFHPELIPASFVVAASSGRQGVPFPVFVEVLIMEIAMEILREASVRMPQQIGGALSIVGVLVVGQAAVQAGFVSPITVFIIALSTIGSFATPSYNAANAFRMLRFFLVILAGIFGLLGLAVGIILVLNHMVSLRSYGIPYLSPIAPGNLKALKDTLIRAPLDWLKERPETLSPKNTKRVGKRVKEKSKNNFVEENRGGEDET